MNNSIDNFKATTQWSIEENILVWQLIFILNANNPTQSYKDNSGIILQLIQQTLAKQNIFSELMLIKSKTDEPVGYILDCGGNYWSIFGADGINNTIEFLNIDKNIKLEKVGHNKEYENEGNVILNRREDDEQSLIFIEKPTTELLFVNDYHKNGLYSSSYIFEVNNIVIKEGNLEQIPFENESGNVEFYNINSLNKTDKNFLSVKINEIEKYLNSISTKLNKSKINSEKRILKYFTNYLSDIKENINLLTENPNKTVLHNEPDHFGFLKLDLNLESEKNQKLFIKLVSFSTLVSIPYIHRGESNLTQLFEKNIFRPEGILSNTRYSSNNEIYLIGDKIPFLRSNLINPLKSNLPICDKIELVKYEKELALKKTIKPNLATKPKYRL